MFPSLGPAPARGSPLKVMDRSHFDLKLEVRREKNSDCNVMPTVPGGVVSTQQLVSGVGDGISEENGFLARKLRISNKRLYSSPGSHRGGHSYGQGIRVALVVAVMMV